MGRVLAEILLQNPRFAELEKVPVRALVDTGAATLIIPDQLAASLRLQAIDQREVTTADGRHHQVPYVGPIQIILGSRSCFTGALVLGDSVLLGVVPLEDMDLVIDPLQQTVTVNPLSPNIPCVLAKGFQP